MLKTEKRMFIGFSSILAVLLCLNATFSPESGFKDTQNPGSLAYANTSQVQSINEIYRQDTRDKLDNLNRSMLASRGESNRSSSKDRSRSSLIAVINDNNSNVRNYPDTNHDVITQLSKNDNVEIIGRWNDWYKIRIPNKTIGWVNEKLIDFTSSDTYVDVESLISEIPLEKPAEVAPSAPKISKGQQVVNYARKFLGVKYVWGGNTPKGFDCSGFVKYVYAKFGVTLNRVAADQAKQGKKVERRSLKPGDLVFFDTNGGHNSINHVGIYIGNGRFIEASSSHPYHKVIITDLDSGFYSRAYMTARRIFN